MGTLGVGWEERIWSTKHALTSLRNLFLSKLKYIVLMAYKAVGTLSLQACNVDMQV